jgi:hypothetical protein
MNGTQVLVMASAQDTEILDLGLGTNDKVYRSAPRSRTPIFVGNADGRINRVRPHNLFYRK